MTQSDETDNPLRWYWAQFEDSDVWSGSFETREEAIAAAAADECWTDDPPDFDEPHEQLIHLAYARRVTLSDDFIDVTQVLEDWCTRNEDAAGDGDLQMSPTSEQRDELRQTLNACFAIWRTRHQLGRAWMLDFVTTQTVPLPVKNV